MKTLICYDTVILTGVLLGNSSPIISWRTKKQNNVELSSCEAEYMALTEVTQERNSLLNYFTWNAILPVNPLCPCVKNSSRISKISILK